MSLRFGRHAPVAVVVFREDVVLIDTSCIRSGNASWRVVQLIGLVSRTVSTASSPRSRRPAGYIIVVDGPVAVLRLRYSLPGFVNPRCLVATCRRAALSNRNASPAAGSAISQPPLSLSVGQSVGIPGIARMPQSAFHQLVEVSFSSELTGGFHLVVNHLPVKLDSQLVIQPSTSEPEVGGRRTRVPVDGAIFGRCDTVTLAPQVVHVSVPSGFNVSRSPQGDVSSPRSPLMIQPTCFAMSRIYLPSADDGLSSSITVMLGLGAHHPFGAVIRLTVFKALS